MGRLSRGGSFLVLSALLSWSASCCLVRVLVSLLDCLFNVYFQGVGLCLLLIRFTWRARVTV